MEKPRELHGKRLIGYSFGNFGIFLVMILTEAYIFNYYVLTLRLDSRLVLFGTTINFVVGAIFSIVFGVMMDNTKPWKLGKRRPYILIGLPIWLVSIILIWLPFDMLFPPVSPNTVMYWPTAIYLWIINSVRAISGTLMMMSLRSVLPEISHTLKNRKKVAVLSVKLQITGSIISLAFPLILQSFIQDPKNPAHWTSSGQFVINVMPVVATIFGGVSAILILIAFFSIDESFHKKTESFERKSLSSAFKNIFIPLRDREFKKYLGASVFSMSSQIIMGTTVINFLSFVMLFQGSEFYYYILISIVTKFGWLFFWKKIQEKQRNLIKTYKLNFVFTIIASLLELIFLIEMDFSSRLILFVLSFGTILGSTYAASVFSLPLMNEIIDIAAKKQLNKGNIEQNDLSAEVTKLSGAYYGLHSFSFSMFSALVAIVYGFIYGGENYKNPVFLTLGLVSMSIFYTISWFFLKSIKIKLE